MLEPVPTIVATVVPMLSSKGILRFPRRKSSPDFCSPHHADSALYPFVAALEQAAGLASFDSHADKLEKLAELLTTLEQPAESVTLLASLLSIPTEQSFSNRHYAATT